MSKPTDDKTIPRCSFCGKPQNQVTKLIAGPDAYICNECIELCNEIIDEEEIALAEESSASLTDLPKPVEI